MLVARVRLLNSQLRSGQIWRGDGGGRVFGLPEDFDDMPVLSIVDGLDGVDAASDGFAGEGGAVGAPDMGDAAEGFGLIFELVLGDNFIAVFLDRRDPVIDSEHAGAGGSDGDEPRAGDENLTEAGAIFAGGAGDGGIESGDEGVEGGGGRTDGRWSLGWRGSGCLGVEQGGREGQQGEKESEASHGGSLAKREAGSRKLEGSWKPVGRVRPRARGLAASRRGWIAWRRRGRGPG